MNEKTLDRVRQRLSLLDERLGHHVRPRHYGMTRPGMAQLEERVKYLSEYTLELRAVLDDLLRGLTEPPAPVKRPVKRQITN